VVYFVCTLIFGLIVNTIVTKILNATHSESISSSLALETGSVAGSISTEEIFDPDRPNPRHSLNSIEIKET
jgi:hypothetical protein